MKTTYFKYAFILLLSIATHTISAQIVSTGHTASEDAEYSANDKLFFYKDLSTASLSAMPLVGGTNVTYTWETYDAGSWGSSTTGNDPTYINIANAKGYRLTVNDNGTLVDQYVCWTFQPEVLNVEVDTIYSNCKKMQLSATASTKPLDYVNPANGDTYSIDYNLSYSWKSEPTSAVIAETIAQPSFDAIVEETTFTVDVSAFNAAHNLTGDFVYPDPKAVEANFTFNVIDREHNNEIPINDKYTELTEYTGSGKVDVTFNDLSKGLNKIYSIAFTTNNDVDKVGDSDLPKLRDESFDEFSIYTMHITVSNSTCSDSIDLGPIEVQEMYVAAPNVFTPDGDGTNDEFMVVYSSIKEFKMVVFNRWGRKVFQTTDPGKSWNGKIAGRNAAEGVYFYVITAKGFNEGESKKIEGPVHLLRGN